MTGLKDWVLEAIAGVLLLALATVFIVFLFTSGDLKKQKAALAVANAQVMQLQAVNATNTATIARQQKGPPAAKANEQIVQGLAGDVATIKARGVSTRTIIEKAKADDPQTRNYLGLPVPDGVRNALNTPAH